MPQLTPEQLADRAKAIDAAYAGIVIPPLALEDLRLGAFYFKTTVERDTQGRIDESASLRNEGARAFLVELEKRMQRAKQRHNQVPSPAVSATAERRS